MSFEIHILPLPTVLQYKKSKDEKYAFRNKLVDITEEKNNR